MISDTNDPSAEQPEDETGRDDEAAGVEITTTEGEGTTFEPEEDPEGHAG